MAEHKTQNAPTTMGGAGSIEPRQPVLPFPVTLIALFEFARAGLILFVVLSPWLGNPTYPVPKSTVQVVTLSAVFFFVPRNEVVDPALPKTNPSEEQFENIMRLLMCAPVAALFAYIGFRLMRRKKSGRALAIVWSALTVLYWLRGLLVSWGFGDTERRYFTSPQTAHNIVLALFLNGFIAVYLLYGNGVAQAFGEKE
jgi:hypothetical protein